MDSDDEGGVPDLASKYEEPDPESRFPDPERELPNVPEAPTPSGQIDPDLWRQFWSLVALANVALLAISLGLMFVGFQGRWTLGGALVAVGLFAAARGYLRYRRFDGGDDGDGDGDE